MTEITIKARVSKDHKLTAKVPPEVPAGEIEIVVRIEAAAERGNAAQLVEFLNELAARHKREGFKGRTKAEIDAYLQEERNSWER